MSEHEIWGMIVFLAVATLIARSSFWLFGHRISLPQVVQQGLRFAPGCALSAIILPDLLIGPQGTDISWHNPRLLGGLAAAIFFLLRKDMLQTICFGMLVFTAARLML